MFLYFLPFISIMGAVPARWRLIYVYASPTPRVSACDTGGLQTTLCAYRPSFGSANGTALPFFLVRKLITMLDKQTAFHERILLGSMRGLGTKRHIYPVLFSVSSPYYHHDHRHHRHHHHHQG